MDLTEAQWQVLRPLLTPKRRPDGRGRPWRDARAVLNGILWVLRAGSPWHNLPARKFHVLRMFQSKKTPQEKYPLTFLLNEASLCISGIETAEWLFVSMPPCAALTKNCVEFFRSESLLVYRGKFSSTFPVDSVEPSHFG